MADFLNVVQSILGNGETPVLGTDVDGNIVSTNNTGAVWSKIAVLKAETDANVGKVASDKAAVEVLTDATEGLHSSVQTMSADVTTKHERVGIEYTDLVGEDGDAGKIGQFNTDYATIDLDKMELVADNTAAIQQIAEEVVPNTAEIIAAGSDMPSIATVATDLDKAVTNESAIISVADNMDIIISVSDGDGVLGAVYNHLTEIDTVSASIDSVNLVGDDIGSVIVVAPHINAIKVVNDNKDNIDTVADDITGDEYMRQAVEGLPAMTSINNKEDEILLVSTKLSEVSVVAAHIDGVVGQTSDNGSITDPATDVVATGESTLQVVGDNLLKGANSEIIILANELNDPTSAISSVEDNAQAAITAKEESIESAELASQWANKLTDDGEVTPGEYSAKKWKQVAEEWAQSEDVIVGTPDSRSAKYWADNAFAAVGVIDDVTASDVTTYSSNKLNADALVQDTAIALNTLKETNVTTDLTMVHDMDVVRIESSDGTNADIPTATDLKAGVMSALMAGKLADIEDRSNHTGTQLASTISDFTTAVQSAETVTTLGLAANVLKYTDEAGAETDLDLSLYLDDTNLARIVSGTVDANGEVTIVRDDASTFVLDFSSLLDNEYTAAEKVKVDGNVADIQAVVEAIGNLANAQGSIESHTVQTVGTAEALLTWEVDTQSTDTEVYEFDAVNNEITFKKPGSYNFMSTLTFESNTNDPVDVTFTLRDTSDDSVVGTQDAHLEIALNDKDTAPVNTLVVLEEAQVPLTVKIMHSADVTGMAMYSFKSILATMESVSAGFADHSQLTGVADTDSHPASAISVVDAGDKFTGTDVEAILAELAGDQDYGSLA